jgi:outer membrane protein TolC
VRYAESAALPSLDAAYQVNYATYNNITGMATPQNFVAISGPPSATNSSNAVFGSAAGLLMNWEMVTFGQRRSRVASAKASLDYQEAGEQNEILRHEVHTANAYLDLVIANELVKVYAKNVSRSQDNLRIVRSLSSSGLRPGVDTAMFQSELARAKIELINQENLQKTFQLRLSELLGDDAASTIIADTVYFSKLPKMPDTLSSALHPLISISTNKLRISEYERSILQRSLYPKLSFWGTAYGRGSGIRYDGSVDSKDGLSLSRYNYGAGLVLSVPLLQYARTQHQLRSQNAQVSAARELVNATNLQLDKQRQLANVTLEHALKVASESPSFFNASNYGYKGLLSRYNAGLLNYTDLIQAQYALVQSEADLKRAYIEAWKALLYLSAVNGDINIFIDQL